MKLMVMVVMMIVMVMMTIMMMMMMTIMMLNLPFDIKHIQDLLHLNFVINIVILSDLHLSSFFSNGRILPPTTLPH